MIYFSLKNREYVKMCDALTKKKGMCKLVVVCDEYTDKD